VAILKNITGNGEGWGDVYNDNVDVMNNQIDSLFDDTKTVVPTGTRPVSALTGNIVAPTAVGTTALAPISISGTGNDADLNTNFAEIQTKIGLIITDLNNVRNTVIADQVLITAHKDKINSLLVELRDGTGVAILNSTV